MFAKLRTCSRNDIQNSNWLPNMNVPPGNLRRAKWKSRKYRIGTQKTPSIASNSPIIRNLDVISNRFTLGSVRRRNIASLLIIDDVRRNRAEPVGCKKFILSQCVSED